MESVGRVTTTPKAKRTDAPFSTAFALSVLGDFTHNRMPRIKLSFIPACGPVLQGLRDKDGDGETAYF